MAAAQRVSKPVSNYGSEFEHMAGAANWGDTVRGGRPITVPPDADDINELNQELFGDESEFSYGAALQNSGNGYGSKVARQPDEVISAEKESSHQPTPRAAPQVGNPNNAYF